MPFNSKNNAIDGNIGIIVVQSMLLTGFDAPIEQVLYLDNVIKEHNLLQAIARVNRVYKNKSCGFVVDYVGVANHLREALSSFEDRDIDNILNRVKDAEIDVQNLEYTKNKIYEFFKNHEIDDLQDIDACVDILADEEARFEFTELFRKFTKNIDRVLPKPEALKYVEDLKMYSFISQSARNRYRDEKLGIKEASSKIRSIVEDFLVSKGVNPKVAPLPIFSKSFTDKIKKHKSNKSKATELESAIKDHIAKHQQEDPELYERISEKLEKLLKEYEDNWDILAQELEKLREEIQKGREDEPTFGLDPKAELPFLGLLKREVYGKQKIIDLDQKEIDLLVGTTKDILEVTKKEVGLVDFWESMPAQKKLKGYILSHLLTAFKKNKRLVKRRNALAQQILELAYNLSSKLKSNN